MANTSKDKINNHIAEEKLEKYLGITKRALGKVKNAINKDKGKHTYALDFLDMAERYYNDALFFKSKGDYVNAFAAVSYAHGWLDAGARIGLFLVNDNKLFTVDEDIVVDKNES